MFVTDEQGKNALAGLTGSGTGNWLRIMLWVSDALRGQGVGSQLIKLSGASVLRKIRLQLG